MGFGHRTEIYSGQKNDHKFWKTEKPNRGKWQLSNLIIQRYSKT